MNALDRIKAKIEIPIEPNACHIWHGAISKGGLYVCAGRIENRKNHNGRPTRLGTTKASCRVSFEGRSAYVPQILWMLEHDLSEPPRLDNLCGNSVCVNLAHYQLSTREKPQRAHRPKPIKPLRGLYTPEIIFAITQVQLTQDEINSSVMKTRVPSAELPPEMEAALLALELVDRFPADLLSEWTGLTITEADLDAFLTIHPLRQ